MAVNTIRIPRPPAVVFGVLADPDTYGRWVVGATDIRDADATWPAPGSMFHHTQGSPLVGLKDTTAVLSAAPPTRLVLQVRARPLLVAETTFDLVEDGDGTRLTMTEWPTAGWLARIYRPRLDRLVHARNAISLRRLGEIAEERD